MSEEQIVIRGQERGHTPGDGENDDGGTHGRTAADAVDDTYWRPQRDARLGDKMVTFVGVHVKPDRQSYAHEQARLGRPVE